MFAPLCAALKLDLAPDAVVEPVPPLATAKVPARVIVPLVVTGPPLVVSPVVPPETSTEVTVPDPPPPLVVVGKGGGLSCRSSNDT